MEKNRIILSGKCDACGDNFNRPKKSTEKENGWPVRLTDDTAPIKVVCGKSECEKKRSKVNKQHRNKSTNDKNPFRNLNRNVEAQALHDAANERFQIVLNNNPYFYRVLRGLTAKVIRDRCASVPEITLMRCFSDMSVNRKFDQNGVVIRGLVQCWHTFLKERHVPFHKLFNQKDNVLANSIEFKLPDTEIDFIFEYIIQGKHSVADFIKEMAKTGATVGYQQTTLYDLDFFTNYTFRITNLKASKHSPGKMFTVDSDYELQKIDNQLPFNQIFQANVMEFNNFKRFADYLNTCTAFDVTCYSLLKAGHESYRVAPSSWIKLHDIEREEVFARTKDNFYFPKAPGILPLDFDDITSFDETIAKLFEIEPILANYSYIKQPSSSSKIYRGFSEMSGETGMRVYFLLDDVSLAPQIAATINGRALMAGLGRSKIATGATFQQLAQGFIDTGIVQPHNADFTCATTLHKGLTQDRRAVFVAGESDVVTTAYIKPLTAAEQLLVAEIEAELRGDKVEAVSNVTVAPSNIMPLDAVITLSRGGNVTVADIIASPAVYHNKSVKCPITGKFGSSKIFVSGDRIVLHTLKSGGRTFMLWGNNVNRFVAKAKTLDINPSEINKVIAARSSGKSRILVA